MGEVIQLQGDQRKDVQEFLTDKKEGLELDAKTIKVRNRSLLRHPTYAHTFPGPWFLSPSSAPPAVGKRNFDRSSPTFPFQLLAHTSSHDGWDRTERLYHSFLRHGAAFSMIPADGIGTSYGWILCFFCFDDWDKLLYGMVLLHYHVHKDGGICQVLGISSEHSQEDD